MNQIETLQAKLDEQKKITEEMQKQIDEMKKGEEKPNRWMPYLGESYYFAAPGSQDFNIEFKWDNGMYDNRCLNRGLCYKTAEDAQKAGKRMFYRHLAESLSDVTYKDAQEEKTRYGSYWNIYYEKIDIWQTTSNVWSSEIYFSSEAKLKEAIQTIGEENWKRYVLGVKE